MAKNAAQKTRNVPNNEFKKGRTCLESLNKLKSIQYPIKPTKAKTITG